MKKIAFLLLISFIIFSCTKPEEEMELKTPSPSASTTPKDSIVAVQFASTVTNVSAYNGTDGKISIQVTAGTSPYTYQIGSEVAQSINAFSGLKAGSYNITVADNKNQKLSKTVEITQPALANLEFTLSGVNISAWGLSDGTITITVTSGMSPYTYSIENGASNNTGIFSGLKAGSYNVKITDSQQQTATKSITLTEPTQPTQSRIVPIYTRDLIDFTSNTTINSYLSALAPITTETSTTSSIFQNRNKFTVSLWYNTGSVLNKFLPTSGNARILSIQYVSGYQGNGEYMSFDLNKTFIQYGRFSYFPSQNVLIKYNTTTAWSGKHHLVLIYDGSEMKMYLDNVLVGSQTTSISILANTIMFGNETTSPNMQNWVYAGVLSDIKIYNDAIDAVEVDNLFNNR